MGSAPLKDGGLGTPTGEGFGVFPTGTGDTLDDLPLPVKTGLLSLPYSDTTASIK